jgi:hypothetical protein
MRSCSETHALRSPAQPLSAQLFIYVAALLQITVAHAEARSIGALLKSDALSYASGTEKFDASGSSCLRLRIDRLRAAIARSIRMAQACKQPWAVFNAAAEANNALQSVFACGWYYLASDVLHNAVCALKALDLSAPSSQHCSLLSGLIRSGLNACHHACCLADLGDRPGVHHRSRLRAISTSQS